MLSDSAEYYGGRRAWNKSVQMRLFIVLIILLDFPFCCDVL